MFDSTLDRYVGRSFLLTFAVTLLVLTFVMCVMVLFRIADFLARGGPARLLLVIFMAGLPSALQFSMPISALTAVLLTFGRLAANGEISAMKSSGIRMWRIMRRPLLLAGLFSAVSLHLNAEVIPNSALARRRALRQLGAETPIQLLEEGRFNRSFPGMTFYFASQKGNQVFDVILYQHQRGQPRRIIRARRGALALSPDKQTLKLDLYEVRVDPLYADQPGFCQRFPIEIDVGRLTAEEAGPKKRSDLTLDELVEYLWFPASIQTRLEDSRDVDPRDLAREHSTLRVELHKRAVLSLSCLAFVLLGIPLATMAHRRESTIGIGISLALVFVFYLFIIIAESLAGHPEWKPHVITWVPLFAAVGIGAFLVHRCD